MPVYCTAVATVLVVSSSRLGDEKACLGQIMVEIISEVGVNDAVVDYCGPGRNGLEKKSNT